MSFDVLLAEPKTREQWRDEFRRRLSAQESANAYLVELIRSTPDLRHAVMSVSDGQMLLMGCEHAADSVQSFTRAAGAIFP